MNLPLQQEPVSKAMALERYRKAQEDFSQPVQGETEGVPDFEWMGELKCSSRTGQPLNTIDNVLIILNHDPKLNGRFWHDEFANRAVVGQAHALGGAKGQLQAESLGGRG